jgi:integrase
MSGKAGNGEGSIYKRADGRWEGAVSLGTGHRRRFYGKTHSEVRRRLVDVQKAVQDGLPFIGESVTVGRYLDTWLEAAKPSLRPQTHLRYEQYVRLHVLPVIGRVSLSKLSPLHLLRLYKDRQDSGLSATSVRQLHAILHRALSQAARLGYVARNVADLVSPPRITRMKMRALSPEQSRALMAAAEGDRFEALYSGALHRYAPRGAAGVEVARPRP